MYFLQNVRKAEMHCKRASWVSWYKHGATAAKIKSAVSWQSDILSAGTVKAHNDIRQNNTEQLTNVGKRHIKRTFDTELRACPQIDGQEG